MENPYRIIVFDNFRMYHPNDSWEGGTFATAEEAIAAVKSEIDDEVAHSLSQVCRQDKGTPTLKRVIELFRVFGETPVAYGKDGHMIFDSFAYMEAKAAELVDQAARHGFRRDSTSDLSTSSAMSEDNQSPATTPAASLKNHSPLIFLTILPFLFLFLSLLIRALDTPFLRN